MSVTNVPAIHPNLAAAPADCVMHNAEFARWAGSEMAQAPRLIDAKKSLRVFPFAHSPLRAPAECLQPIADGVPTVTSYIGRVRFHRERARLFHMHAGHSKSPDGRAMYFRLVRVEVALAEQNELLAQVALEQELAATTQPQPAGPGDDRGRSAAGESHS